MNEMQRDLFFEILDAFDFEVKVFQNRKRLSTATAIHTDDTAERQKYLNDAKQYDKWAKEATETKRRFSELYKPAEE